MRDYGLSRLLITLIAFAALLNLSSSDAEALPIGFGRNQGDLEFDEIKTDNFIIYHDRRAPREAKAVLDALEAARPKLESWLGVKRDKALPVLMSSTTSNASFANFITDVLEIQSLGRGGRDLAWHEYTHSTMYRHLDNIFGPAGSIIHLPWMPAWWIEGLAESTSLSSGSDSQYGIERYYGMNGGWPSYDKLHALYDGTRFSSIGYAVSGGFVSYILRTYGADKLPQAMESFYEYSMPWWWPWSVVPFNKFMPFDEALYEWTGKYGHQLYDEYKTEASDYWKSRSDLPFLVESKNKISIKEFESKKSTSVREPSKGLHAGRALTYNSSFYFQNRGDDLYLLNREDGELYDSKVIWKDNAIIKQQNETRLPDDLVGPRIVRKEQIIYLKSDINQNYDVFREFWIQKGEKTKKVMKRFGYVTDMFMAKDKLVWVEEKLERQWICHVPRSAVEKFRVISPKLVKCESPAYFPESIQVLGSRTVKDESGQEVLGELWIRRSQETLLGDKHGIEVWDAATTRFRKFSDPLQGKPISLGFAGNKMVVAYADSTTHFLRRFDSSGRCLSEQTVGNMIDRVFNNSQGQTVLSLWRPDGVLLLTASNLPVKPTACRTHDEPHSPLQIALRYPQATFSEVLAQRNPWDSPSPAAIESDAQKVSKQAVLGSGLPSGVFSEPSTWRGRPVFAFPWVAIDALGYQYGTLAVPLMDHLQNETVTLMALYGAESRFPSVDLNLTSTRFSTTFMLDIYRHQTWNGSYRGEVYYYDERGAMFTAARYIELLDLSLRISYKQADLIPFLGNELVWDQIAKGYIRETSIDLRKSHRLFDWISLGYFLSSDLATKFDNKNYDSEQTGGGFSLHIPIEIFGRSTAQSWGVSYSRVRGERRRLLKEAYRPLRTYVPGSGGGLNEINQPIFGPGALTSAVYGDTQARANVSWSVPLIPDLAKLVHIVYLQRLDFTTFFNYGNAWYHRTEGNPGEWVKAHGYNLDLTADIKGVKLNAGLGVGQVVGSDWEMYALIGFDALIQQGER